VQALTLLQLLVPLIGVGIKVVFGTLLFLGPGLSVVVNLFKIVYTLLCIAVLFFKSKVGPSPHSIQFSSE